MIYSEYLVKRNIIHSDSRWYKMNCIKSKIMIAVSGDKGNAQNYDADNMMVTLMMVILMILQHGHSHGHQRVPIIDLCLQGPKKQ